MLGQLFKGLHFLHVVFFLIGAVGFFTFWARTRFWLPKYVHVLAAIGLAVGLWCISTLAPDAPINKSGLAGRFLLALAIPAIVYFFFIFHGGQSAAFRRRFQKTIACPHCNSPVVILQNKNSSASTTPLQTIEFLCPHCGQSVMAPNSHEESL